MFFASDSKQILKWTLNRVTQARNTRALYEIADVKRIEDIYKHNRPHEIIKSERFISKLHDVITKEYLNPFDAGIDASQLYNLSSGMPVETVLGDSILKVWSNGKTLYEEFVAKRIRSTEMKVHDPIKRQELTLFKNAGKTVTVKAKNKREIIEANQNVLGKLLAHSAKTIDFERALTNPLYPVPLAFPDGTRRTTAKSKFMEVILSYCSSSTDPKDVRLPDRANSTYLVDLMAWIRTMAGVPDIYHELALRLFDMLPVGYSRVDIVADTYQQNSLKDPERDKRGTADKFIVKSSQSKIPKNFPSF